MGLFEPDLQSSILEQYTRGMDSFFHSSASIGPLVTFDGNHWIGAHSVIGSPPEHRTLHGMSPGGFGVEVASGVIIRENVSIQWGTERSTYVGQDSFVMSSSTIGHDVILEDSVTLGSGSHVGGHAVLGTGVTLGMGTCVHQKALIGGLVMSSMNANLKGVIPPFTKVVGDSGRIVGMNEIGISRAGLAGEWTLEFIENLPQVFDGWHPASIPPKALKILDSWNLNRGLLLR